MKYLLGFLVFVFLSSALAGSEKIKFAPLPMYKSELVIKHYQGMLDYLSKKLGVEFEIVYYADYAKLLEAIEKGEVAMAHLGPLPYAALLNRTKTPKPLVQFLDAKGLDHYTCSLVTLKKSCADKQGNLFAKVALTQKFSTCGYLATSEMVQKYGVTLDALESYYSGTHSHVILDLLLAKASVGSVRTSEFTSYEHLGIKELERSQSYPGFLLVGTSSMSEALALQIQEVLVSLKPLENKEDAQLTKEWGTNVKYGAIKAASEPYEEIAQKIKNKKFAELK